MIAEVSHRFWGDIFGFWIIVLNYIAVTVFEINLYVRFRADFFYKWIWNGNI